MRQVIASLFLCLVSAHLPATSIVPSYGGAVQAVPLRSSVITETIVRPGYSSILPTHGLSHEFSRPIVTQSYPIVSQPIISESFYSTGSVLPVRNQYLRGGSMFF
eukprot:Gregarina_sp_Pseudo_9__666@NODE_1423_length_1614_cov_207_309841_g1321_i0_p4_GENE_NODE_1423_length_1614_cov_207_309841_g1321_i0NODE_1423_length_1614_cov_207_309841_g1321_i0_p4_ORF_typecomplete_len105_score9_40_NODE_1423_length_1614_cov_207_309841_g1321_i012911605